MKEKTHQEQDDKILRNNEIRTVTRDVRIIDGEENLGVMSVSKGIQLAEERKLDLVLIGTGKQPVAKILDYSKYIYELKKKAKEQAKKNKAAVVETKTIQFRPSTDEHDIQTKLRRAKGFFEKGNKVVFKVQMKRGRELATQQPLARKLLERVATDLSESTKIEKPISMQERDMTMLLSPA